jgi:hypothetical protein
MNASPMFFDKISAYRDDPGISVRLRNDGIVLLNKPEITDYIVNVAPASVTRERRSVLPPSDIHDDFIEDQKNDFFENMAMSVCGGIGEEYGQLSTKLSMSKPNFDILIAAKSDYKTIEISNSARMMEDKIDKILGFIIVEKGECPKYPTAYAINLICTRPGTMKGSILMGAYLYMIKEHRYISQVGLLELASGYSNIAGICAYNKFGFDKDTNLYKGGCFQDTKNLPMSVYLGSGTDPLFNTFVPNTSSSDFDQNHQELTANDIINIVLTNKPVTRITRFKPVDLCGVLLPTRGTPSSKLQGQLQQSIAEKYNRIYNLEINPDKNMNDIQTLVNESLIEKQNMDTLKKNTNLRQLPTTRSTRSGLKRQREEPMPEEQTQIRRRTGRGKKRTTKKRKRTKKTSKSKKYRR